MANSTTIIIKITKGLDGYGRAIKGHTAINRKKKKPRESSLESPFGFS